MKNILTTVSIALITFLFISCKKDKLAVNEEQLFLQADFKFSADSPYDAGWQLRLRPDGVANIIPSGDVGSRGTYKISAHKLKVKTDQDKFEFVIVSKEELRETKYGVVLKLKHH